MKTPKINDGSPQKIEIPESDFVRTLQIKESLGDQADQAQDQIDCDINEKIYQIRKNLRSIKKNEAPEASLED